ncbi:MAG TPA: hypothetical protein VFX70_01805 [Mycobacteriales bacterium]|nr:hypothetical protein [Mycobacteriales bacterium]
MIGRRRTPVGRALLVSATAGAAGTAALDAVTYLDMLARGRPVSEIPATLATRITGALEMGLGDQPQDANRARALGGLLGNLTALTVAVGYGLVRRVTRPRPTLAAGLVLGAAAMAASDTPIAMSGVSDLRRWGVAGWMADILPHAAYGLTVVTVHEALIGRSA